MQIPEQETAVSQIRHFISIFSDSEGEIKPHFMLVGETGSGKTFNLKSVADEFNIAMVEVNASGITREGVSGNSLSKAMAPLQNNSSKPTVIFVDEFDKTLMKSGGLTEGAYADLQFEFLKMLEPDGTVDVFGDYGKYTSVNTNKCLFVFGGAFGGHEIEEIDDLSKFGLRAEFMGRVGQIIHTDRVTLDSLCELASYSKLMSRYMDLFDVSEEDAVLGAVDIITARYQGSVIGVRLVDSAIHEFFLSVDPDLRIKPEKKAKSRTINAASGRHMNHDMSRDPFPKNPMKGN